MRDRLMVGHAPLEGGIMVRVHVPQFVNLKTPVEGVFKFIFCQIGLEQVRSKL